MLPIDVELFRTLLDYCPDTGVLSRKTNTRTRKNAGSVVGQLTRKGYLQAKFNGVSMLVHRVCYAIHHGVDPGEYLVDHIDGDRTNNRITNLRLCNNSQNLMNRRGVPSHSTTRIRGVHFSKKERKYIAHLKLNGKLCRLGAFDDVNEATVVASNARKLFYGEFCGADV
jgi:hypothetical protein